MAFSVWDWRKVTVQAQEGYQLSRSCWTALRVFLRSRTGYSKIEGVLWSRTSASSIQYFGIVLSKDKTQRVLLLSSDRSSALGKALRSPLMVDGACKIYTINQSISTWKKYWYDKHKRLGLKSVRFPQIFPILFKRIWMTVIFNVKRKTVFVLIYNLFSHSNVLKFSCQNIISKTGFFQQMSE